jgi:hypothetical protein
VPDQVNKEIEHLGLDSHQGSSTVQFATISVECTILE